MVKAILYKLLGFSFIPNSSLVPRPDPPGNEAIPSAPGFKLLRLCWH